MITLVTGLWDLKRDTLGEGWARPFESHYLEKFKQLLSVDNNLIILKLLQLLDVKILYFILKSYYRLQGLAEKYFFFSYICKEKTNS